MKNLQIGVFVLGLLLFAVALPFAGQTPGLVLWMVGMAAMAADVVMLLLWPQRPAWTRPGHCVHCGYDLTGNATGRCPECGKEVLWSDRLLSSPQRTA